MELTQLEHHEQLQLLSLVAQLTESLVVITDPAQNIEWVNPAFEKLTGYNLEEVKGKNPRFLQGEGTDATDKTKIREALAAQKPISQEILNYDKYGKPYWLMMTITPVFDKNQELKYFISVEQDITYLKQTSLLLDKKNHEFQAINEELRATNEELQVTDEELRANNELLLTTNQKLEEQVKQNQKLISKQQEHQKRLLQNQIEINQRNAELKSVLEAVRFSSIVSISDKKGIIIDANEKFCAISGYSYEELVGQNHSIVNSGYHPKGFWVEMWQRITKGKFWKGEICNRAKDGRLYWVDTSITPIFDAQGKVDRYLSIRYLITKRKEQEKQIRQLTDNLQSTLDNSTNAIALYDLEGNMILADKKLKELAQTILGFDLQNQHNIFKAAKNTQNPFLQRALSYFIKACVGESSRFTRKLNHKWYEITFNPIVEEGIVNGVVYSILDISEQQAMQEQLYIEHQNLEVIVQNLDDIVFQLNGEGCFLNVWTSNEKHLFMPPNEFLGKTLLEISPDDWGQNMTLALKNVCSTHQSQTLEYGSPFDPELFFRAKISYAYQTPEGEDRLTVLVENISERKKQEKEIAEQALKINQLYSGVMSSINYARRIQTALLPRQDEMDKVLPENFIFYRPKNIVSGDFYWIFHKLGTTFLATADCTGHGVPGAFMSMIGIEALNKLVSHFGILSPDFILYELHRSIRQTLRYTEEKPINDGMDISLCVFHKNTQHIEFAGAMSVVYLVENEQVIETKGNGYPIGGFHKLEDRIFTKKTIPYQKGSMLYTTTDGFKDQFGEKQRTRFKSIRFKEMLLKIAPMPLDQQQQEMENTMREWQGNVSQIDDMLVIGIRL